GAGLAIVRRTAPDHARLPTMVVAALVTVVVAAALVLSRKTAGGAALMPGVVGMTLVFGSGLARIPADGRWSVNSGVIHLLWTAMAGLLLWAAVDPLPPHSFVTLCTWLGAAVVAAAGVAPWLRSSSPETSRDDAA
ncbi:MAG: hypothetical protein K0V04_23845, partial [Deltaproteobacteria bacterium]|nr:hypothetical protein [Deltaproteobacteria bacterium]